MASYHGQTLLKPRSTKVKPILRKLTQSEKNSLDLDRPAAEQDGVGLYDYGGGRLSHDTTAFGQAGRRGYHIRSTSGTSQFSTATSTSGTRTGSFVHPFQQTPRPYTPPQLASSYQNSLRESDDSNSPDPTEDEEQQQYTSRRTSNPSTATPSLSTAATAPPARPGLQPHLRIQTNKQSSRGALSTSHTSHQTHLSPLSPVEITSSIDTMTPSSALRSSFDANFRLRSRSEVDPRDRATLVQEARRKFMEKEQAKEEKAAREEIRQREKRNQKEAQKIERSHRQSSASDATRSKRSKSDLTMQSEKQGGGNEGLFAHQGDETGGAGAEAFPTDEQQRRSYSATNNAKKKTHSAWTKLMMWIRTRFIRMKGKKRPPPPVPFHAYGATRH